MVLNVRVGGGPKYMVTLPLVIFSLGGSPCEWQGRLWWAVLQVSWRGNQANPLGCYSTGQLWGYLLGPSLLEKVSYSCGISGILSGTRHE